MMIECIMGIQKIQYLGQIQMHQRQSPTKGAEKKTEKSVRKVQQVSTIKRSRISNYPYYPVTDCMNKNNISYIFNLDMTSQEYMLIVVPFISSKNSEDKLQYTQLSSSYIELQCISKRLVNFLKVIDYQDTLDSSGRSVSIKNVDFVIGYSAGFLIRLRYRSKADHGKRQLIITGKYNKKPEFKEGFFTRMNNTFFGTEQFYKVAEEKPVRAFYCHTPKVGKGPNSQKYYYSYLIGNHLYMCRQFSELVEAEALRTFSNIEWESLPMDSQAKLNNINAIVIKSKRHRTLVSSTYMLIKWADEISSYCYTAQNDLIVSDNQDNKIIIFDVLDNLRIKAAYSLDLDVKKLNYIRTSVMGVEQAYLIIMPYDTALYIINLSKNLVTSLKGHKSYVTQAIINESGYIVTGGCDHRIGLKNLNNLQQDWCLINSKKGASNSDTYTRYYEIDSSQVPRSKVDQTYFLGQFNNVNSERNNNAEYGFGNFMQIPTTHLYAYITYDFIVKMYKLLV